MEEITTNSNSSKPSADTGKQVVKPMEGLKIPVGNKKVKIAVYLLVVLLGAATGYGAYAYTSGGTARIGGKDIQVVKTPTEEGVKDAATFKDTATGQLIANDGKITDEGTHILKRGDNSQNVYLTSSVVDLSKYEGKKVQVWGSTYQGQKAGWLMDVGRIKLVQ